MTYPSITCVKTLGFTIAFGSPLSDFVLVAVLKIPFTIIGDGKSVVVDEVVVAVVVIDKEFTVDDAKVVVVVLTVPLPFSLCKQPLGVVSIGVDPLSNSLALSATVAWGDSDGAKT